MKTLQVIVKCRIVGFHRWPDAPFQFDYLSKRHRHEFVVICRREVSSPDREVEVNQFQSEIDAYLMSKYGMPCEFGDMSCEDIARDVLTRFGLASCVVLEDGINGAEAVSD